MTNELNALKSQLESFQQQLDLLLADSTLTADLANATAQLSATIAALLATDLASFQQNLEAAITEVSNESE
jgi:hypothetical protein